MLPLTGITILDVSQTLPGPYATMLLADLGADVIKVERPGTGDPFRHLGRGMFETVNRNKRSIALDLKKPEALDVFFGLARTAHAVVEAYRPGVAERLGIAYDRVKAVNPSVVYCSIAAFGQTGPLREIVGHDLNMALTGVLSMAKDRQGRPVRPGLPIADLTAAMFAAFTIVSAIRGAEQTGEGRYLDVSMADALLAWTSVRLPEWALGEGLPDPNAYGLVATANDFFETSDGEYIAIAAQEEKLWQNLCRAIGKLEWLADPRYADNAARLEHRSELLAQLQATFKARTRSEWLELLKGSDVPYSPVNSVAEAMSTPQFSERGLFQQVQDRQGRVLNQIRFPVPLDSEVGVRRAPPALGEHTADILRERLGMRPEDVQALQRSGAIGICADET
ncbi:MAG: CoA transferase [Firmicutes bacterium]|nr:CoA transferase [Bacillota bacterium]